MEQFPQFIGRLHPLLVHLPIGLFVLLALIELAALWPRAPRLTASQRALILALGLVFAVGTAACGWLLAGDGDYDPALLDRHRWLGVAFTGAALALLLARNRPRLYAGALAATVALLAVAGHFGGALTHGENYLTAPFARTPAVAPVDPAQALAYQHVIQPILEQRCVSCHGPSKEKGGLRLDSIAALGRGGKSGPALKPGQPDLSEMIRRVHLPLDAEEHMPPKGKPQLDGDEATLLEWWIETGASATASVAELAPPPLISSLVAARLGVPPEPDPDRAAMLAAAARLERELGILVRPLAADAPWLDVNARLRFSGFGDAQLAALASIAPAIVQLDLGETAVTDAGLATLTTMKRLRRLHLDRTAVTDAGLRHLTPLLQLESLNLHTTGITGAGLDALRPLPRLRSLYVWRTSATPDAVASLADALTDERLISRWRAEIGDLEARIRAERFQANLGETLPAPPAPEPKPAEPEKKP